MWLIAAAASAVTAVLLAWPVPEALCAANWTKRSPRAAIVLWQLVGLVGGLSAISTLLLLGIAPLGRDWTALNAIALVLALLLFSWLVGVLATSAVRIERDLRRQRAVVDLLGRAEADGVRVLDHPEPLAYCLPGPHPRIVITDGALAALPPDELAAVLAHERAHAAGRHELVIQPFVAWQSALPFLPPARRATAAVAELVEMLADDAAARATSRRTVARALARVGAGRPPGMSDAMSGSMAEAVGGTEQTSVIARVRRLT
ncbi:MAG TPA: M56 family metallopeptidase [Actinocrinis sp.]|uniref:M56 family metallopeptidase n=1 Tax=Actinocrinis sp. TaxID=1920516 RepID=UPI002DDCD94B|nr:M56 family metallopeptidase [Actinocrinis sp.]HEV2343907.1 M56 family metallopeptidase [Actinocrinis sp.]